MLRDALTACQQQIQSLEQTRFAPLSLAQTADNLRLIDITPVMPNSSEQLKLYKKFGHALATNDWHAISRDDWRRVPWLLWYGKKLHYLIIQRGFLDKLWQQIGDNPSSLKRLIHVYLLHFSLQKPHIQQVATFIRQQLDNLPPYSALQQWQQTEKVMHLFDLPQGVHHLANNCLREPAIPVLEQAGLSGELLSAGYAEAVYQQALNNFVHLNLEEKINSLPRLLQWSAREQTLRYPHCRKAMIEALLQPWLGQSCPENTQQKILFFLLQHAQHPVINQTLWQSIKPPLFKLFKHWSNHLVLTLFFDLLAQYQWINDVQERQDFWLHCHQQQIIDDAWLILNPQIAQLFANTDLAPSLQHCYGTFLADDSIQDQHVVLLLRIQNLIIVLWADGQEHRLWSLKNPYLPMFYKAEYAFDSLQHPSEQLPITENWQTTLLNEIYQRTQIRVAPLAPR